MMSDHHDSIVEKTLLKQNMVWKPIQIAPSSSARVVVMSLWILLDVIDSVINLLPELVVQFIRDLRIHCSDLACILRSSGMNNE